MATFKNVGSADTLNIMDIKVTGWEDVPDYAEGWTGPQVTKIDNLGYTMNNDGRFGDDTISWTYIYDNPDGEGIEWVAHWLDDYAGDYIENLEGEKYTLTYGEGLWIDMPYSQYGEEIKFVYAGEVVSADHGFLLRDGLNLAGNPMPTSVNIVDVDVIGWEEIPDYAEGWTGPQVTKIDNLGYTMNNDGRFGDDTVSWTYIYDNPDGEGIEWVAHWLDDYAGDYVENLEGEKYTIKEGEGLWIDNPYAQYGEKIRIVFPSPIADHSAE